MNILKSVAVALTVMMASTGAKATIIGFDGGLDPFFNYTGVFAGTPSLPGSGYESVQNFTGSNTLVLNPSVPGMSLGSSPSSFELNGVGTFDLTSFVIAGAWGSQVLSVEGMLNGTQLFSNALAVTTAAQLVSLNWIGIDELRIFIDPNGLSDAIPGQDGQNWALDNLTVNESVAVPEPGMLVLFGLCAAGLAIGRRRQAV